MAQLTVIIPAYNEILSLPSLLERVDLTLKKSKITYTALVIDDHSTDQTYKTVKSLEKKYPVTVVLKKGVRGKAQSIIEGVALADSEYIVMIDADLQYPPEAIPEMLQVALEHGHGVVVARRKVSNESLLRRVGSRGIALLCGKVLHGLDVDIQSGLKLFSKRIVAYIDKRDITPWSFDLPLLHTAKQLGHTVGQVEIDFVKREHGSSKLSLLKPTFQIMHSAVKLKFRYMEPETTSPTEKGSMIGAGVRHKGKQFVTHSTLDHRQSALHVITPTQRSVLFLILGVFLLGLGFNILLTFKVVVALLSFVYFVDVIFNFVLILKSLHSPPEIAPTAAETDALVDANLPIYTILCPLYREAHVIPQFVEAIERLEWPKNKLDVMLLLEEDDTESVEAVKTMRLPSYIRAVVVPDSQPKTKPKACNYGLNLAKGEYVVIYDAEDSPDPLQLKKAYVGFQTVGPQVKCLQAKLNYYNPSQNWLTRLFTAEYSLWFDVILTGLQSIGTSIPLGGTSNHFRKADLLEFEGWDPFNVTEDADLGIRLFKRGAKTAIIDSTTLEEANSNVKNWIRQRSRWIKGYMQTYLLHMRDPLDFASKQGIHAVFFQLTVGGKIAFILINPILWVLTISYFVLYRIVGPTIESLYPTIVFYMAVTSLLFGNFMFIYYYMIGAAKRGHWWLMKWIYLIPLYWLMVSVAAAMALYQLIVKPHYWEKTIHGLHLKKEVQKKSKSFLHSLTISILAHAKLSFEGSVIPQVRTLIAKLPKRSAAEALKRLISGKQADATVLVIASLLANILNMLSSVIVGKELVFSGFALYSTITSLLYFVYIPAGALGSAVNYKTAFLVGKYKRSSIFSLWKHYVIRGVFLTAILTGSLLIFSPALASFLHHDSLVPLLIFAPTIGLGIVSAITSGYLYGTFSFRLLALSSFIEPFVRVLLVLGLLLFGLPQFIIAVPTLAMAIGVGVTVLCTMRWTQRDKEPIALREFRFPWSFFAVTLLSGISSIAFFSLDIVLAAHFLSSDETGMYGVLAVLGKMIFFAGGLTAGFILPFVSKKEGEGHDSKSLFSKLFAITVVLALGAQCVVGIGLPLVAPLLGSDKLLFVRHLLPIYGFGIVLYTLSQTILSYYLAKKEYAVAWISLFLAGVQIVALWLFHGSIDVFVLVMALMGLANFIVFGVFHQFYRHLQVPMKNLSYFSDLFKKLPRFTRQNMKTDSFHVLIFNWRDTKHDWAGGAEIYIHEIAKRIVQSGSAVTVFCGNDGRSSRNEVIDGVRIIRRGGFYTVYIWAALYYLFRLRKTVDLVLDSENGIPFLTPLYVRKPIYLLIHHIHQDVFRAHLRFPLSEIAAFIEGDLMPLLYRNEQIITVSSSSKQDIIDLGLGTKESISVINPGIDATLFHPARKTTDPSLVYVGRLKPYKNVDRAIRAFSQVVKEFPKATFTIAGSGESQPHLLELVQKLDLEKQVLFRPFITDEEKVLLFAKSWVAIQPSMMEGFGITIIEANACKTPVIASNVKGLKDSVENKKTGLLVASTDTAAFAQAICLLFSDKELREELSQNAYEWAKGFSWENSTQKMLAHFTEEEKRSSLHAATNVIPLVDTVHHVKEV